MKKEKKKKKREGSWLCLPHVKRKELRVYTHMRSICARVYTHLPYPPRHRHVSATSAPSTNLYIISKLTPELCSFSPLQFDPRSSKLTWFHPKLISFFFTVWPSSFSPLHFDPSRSQTFYLQFGPKDFALSLLVPEVSKLPGLTLQSTLLHFLDSQIPRDSSCPLAADCGEIAAHDSP